MNILFLNLFARDAHNRLDGATLGTPTWYRPLLVIPCRAGRRTWYMVAVMESPGPFVFLTTDRPLEGARAPERFAVLSDRRITSVHAQVRDRLLEIDVDAPAGGAAGPMTLRLHLYGAQGSVQLRRDGSTLESVGARRRPERAVDRPPSIVDIDADTLTAALAGADSEAPLHQTVPGLDAPLVAAFGGAAALDTDALLAFRDRALTGSAPFSMATARRLANAVPVPSDHAATVASGATTRGPFDTADAAARDIGGAILDDAKQRIVAALAKPLRRHLAAQRKLLENLGHDLERSRGHDRVRREAETLAAYQSGIRPGAGVADLPDPYDPERTLSIILDPALPIRTQIEKRFRKATKLEKSESHTRRRIELVEREVREIEAALTVLDQDESFAKALLHLEAIRSRFDISDTKPARRAPGRETDRPALPYRKFDLGEGWSALVGRSSRDNDELTFRHASPDDLWLHAQSVPGSHVVLKSPGPEQPPPQILERAASLAAHFSRSRHSGLVPVIYTRRKYVRKFRGSKPGQVRCEREKMVMVPPDLPEDEK